MVSVAVLRGWKLRNVSGGNRCLGDFAVWTKPEYKHPRKQPGHSAETPEKLSIEGSRRNHENKIK